MSGSSPPPEIAGLTYLGLIGSGGFADVFLYQQHHPRRRVAVKVLRHEHVSPDSLRQFEQEANTMALISDHQFIVAIFDAGVSPDGRPYILMEFYPNDHFALRARGGTLRVPLVLQVGVQVASAVATAHQASILHRDIKPANILTSRSHKPGLTDFGISASSRADLVDSGQGGFTVAYAAPEVLQDPWAAGTVLADVYSLGATLYALLEGRAPFHDPGGDNLHGALTDRVIRGAAQPMTRIDVPASLRHLVANAMAADPASRPPTALAFAAHLQDIEQELQLPPTQIELVDAHETTTFDAPAVSGPPTHSGGGHRDTGPEGVTRMRSTPAAGPDRPDDPGRTVGPPAEAGAEEATRAPEADPQRPTATSPAPEDRPQPGPAPESRPARSVDPEGPAGAEAAPVSRRTLVVAAVAALVLLVVAVAGLLGRGGGEPTDAGQRTSDTAPPNTDLAPVELQAPARPTEASAVLDPASNLTVRWTPARSAADDGSVSYWVKRSGEDGYPTSLGPEAESVTGTQVVVPEVDTSRSGGRVCIEVWAVQDGRQSEDSATACTSPP